MNSLFDRYSWRARVIPVYITAMPAVLALVAWLPQSLALPTGAITTIVLVPLAYLASQVGADFGKRLEKHLWLMWDGPPTTRFLRHANDEFNAVTREKLFAKLRSIGLDIPSEDCQERNPRGADTLLEACTSETIRRTRNRERFPLVHQGLTDYGFRRNLLGLKPFGLALSIVAELVCLWRVIVGWGSQEVIAIAMGALVVSLLLLVIWVFLVKERWVAASADRYARYLLEATLELE